MTALLLDEKMLAIEAALVGTALPHAFGGALALAYYATPRATHDIDVNVFVPAEQSFRVLDALTPLGVDSPSAAEQGALRDRGQVRVFWEHTPIDLFFSYDPLHDRAMERTREVPFGDDATIPVLSAEDLAIFKALFDRPKDWRDIEELLFALGGDFEDEYALGWLRSILDGADERLVRFEALVRPAAPRD